MLLDLMCMRVGKNDVPKFCAINYCDKIVIKPTLLSMLIVCVDCITISQLKVSVNICTE